MNDDLQHFTCRNCNADLDTGKAIDGVISCPYCGTPWTLPKRDIAPESARLIYAGYASLDVSKFDEAFTYFSKASELAPKEPEAYFGMALATYQVQYLKDVEKNRLQPICHRFVNKKFRDDVNYQKALSLATYNQGKEYKIRAEQIDEIRKEFLALQAEGIDYDCFICTKVTDEEGKKTEDSTRANDIYFHLLDKGYKPFFSERDLKGRTGANYEAFILYALYMSECMLVVCSREEYLQTKWVKSEYTRFLSMVVGEEKERDALSIVFYRDPIEKLPNGKKIQSIDYSKPDAFQAIDAFVENHTPEATKRRKEEIRDKQKSSESTGSDSYESPRQNHRGSSEKISKIALIGFVVAACIIWIPLTVFAIGNGLGNNEGSSSAGVSWNPIDLNGYTRLCVEDNQGYNPYKLNEDPTDTEIHDHFT
ncbi:MAG: toll/interleukin-1 receptor domain-containing protein, partial [Fibrobacter sp.]|nr:toll/interleukin-1 receptor domain-containing protein [Fibrobacter sp.]